jgi:AcrR family transcriptional regulator
MSEQAVRTRRTQAERTATAAQRMLRAAGSLIARQGYTKTSLAQVGKQAGYTAGLVSHHFGSKEGLLRDLVARISGRFYSDQLAPATEGRMGLEALCASADTYLGELVVREERMRTLYVLMGESLGPVSEINPVFAELNRGFRENARRWIEGGIESGEIRADVDADAEAALFVGMLRGVAMQWMTDPGCFELEAVGASLKTALQTNLTGKENSA